uniref:Uncharacterized protein n=1 Tax=Panagrolaimus sp. PS1159 TaxID=55785 RepID=A0AC35FHN0_9BILA
MGNVFSSQPEPAPLTETPEQMPDFNNLFQQGVPKMMQVADDVHRMTDYVRDFRNMMVGIVLLSIIGALIFLFLQCRNGKQRRSNRGRLFHSSSERSSLGHHPYMEENSKVELMENTASFISKVP